MADKCFSAVQRLVVDAGDIAVDRQSRLSEFAVLSKGPLDLVSEADRTVEKVLSDGLLALFPDDGFCGEESGLRPGRSNRVWIVDPIDGTFNFVRGGDQWGISVGLLENGQIVYGVIYVPRRKELLVTSPGHAPVLNGRALRPLPPLNRSRAAVGIGYHPSVPISATLGVINYVVSEAGMTFRHSGAAIISLLELIRGEIDAYVGLAISSWDAAGATPAILALGGFVNVNWASIDLNTRLDVACGTAGCLAALDPLFQSALALKN